MTRTTNINALTVSKIAGSLPDNAPVCMVNLLRYKEYADYNNAAHLGITPVFFSMLRKRL